MMQRDPLRRKPVNTLFVRLSITFLAVLVVMAGIYVVVSVRYSQLYYEEVNQRLNRSIARHITNELPMIVGGTVNDSALKQLFHDAMVLNPHLEIYLLDTTGKILTYSAPDSKIHLDRIPLPVIKDFLNAGEYEVLLGPDPRNPGVSKAFSAHPVEENGKLSGYIYVILASEVFESVAHGILGSYMLRLSVRIMLITLAAALIVGLAAIWYLTRSFREIIAVVNQFRSGNFGARMQTTGRGSLASIAETFNDLAERVMDHVETIRGMEKTRRQLIANISHDLRTPLATMQGYTETLLMKRDTLKEKERIRYLEIILRGTKRLRRLVDDLFELSKLEARETPLEVEHFSLADLVQDNYARYQMAAEQKRVRLDATIPKDLPLVKGDIRYIDRVLQNLIGNAVKFNRENGHVTITLGSLDGHVSFLIANDGPGITPRDIPHLFEAFKTGTHNRSHTHEEGESTGLGLAIVKQILTRHGSTIDVQSRPNGLTQFSFCLPVADDTIAN